MFQLTAARRRLGVISSACCCKSGFQLTAARRRLARLGCASLCGNPCFNSQPPEGGWSGLIIPLYVLFWFQLTAARRRLVLFGFSCVAFSDVSTHSRPKAAGWPSEVIWGTTKLFQLTAARRRLEPNCAHQTVLFTFQLTAARRRLVVIPFEVLEAPGVSTHSRPKAAGKSQMPCAANTSSFNSQPPEGGWRACFGTCCLSGLFQLTAARRRLG